METPTAAPAPIPAPVPEPTALRQSNNPMLGMSRDFGSFLGGIPLPLPMAPMPMPVAAPARPVRQTLFGDTPVSLAGKVNPPLAQPVAPAPMGQIRAPDPKPTPMPVATGQAVAAPAAVQSPVVVGGLATITQTAGLAQMALSPTVPMPAAPVQPMPTPVPIVPIVPPSPPIAPPVARIAPSVAMPAVIPASGPDNLSPPMARAAVQEARPVAPVAAQAVSAPIDAPDESDSNPSFEQPGSDDPEPSGRATDNNPENNEVMEDALVADAGPVEPAPPPPVVKPKPVAAQKSKPEAKGAVPLAAPAPLPAKPKRAAPPPPPARAGARRPPTGKSLSGGISGVAGAVLPPVDVFSQHPVGQGLIGGVPEIPPAGFIPPGSGGARRQQRPPAGSRPPVRAPGDAPPAKRKPTRKPAVVETHEAPVIDGPDQIDDVPPPDTLEPPQDTEASDSPPDQPKAKKRWRFPFFGGMLLLLALGGAAAAWYFLPPRADLRISLGFDGLSAMQGRDRIEFQRGQIDTINTDAFQSCARELYASKYNGRAGGFLRSRDDRQRRGF